MDISCYRSTPKIVGALIDVLYQNPTLVFAVVVGLSGLVGIWRYKANNKPE
ncbi:hypothetical protein [Methylomonas koyamae]|uniref:hypothetical protein n=1 Tax=Methylomonas koyamae TaxID=702114 RepID=UPI001642E198|nr:hypothetical protein [Methylomonas koyamae]